MLVTGSWRFKDNFQNNYTNSLGKAGDPACWITPCFYPNWNLLDPNDWIQKQPLQRALALVGASAVPAATPCGKNLSCIGMQLNAWMRGDTTRIALQFHRKKKKTIETWSVCNHRSFRIDRNVSTALFLFFRYPTYTLGWSELHAHSPTSWSPAHRRLAAWLCPKP